MATRGRPKKVQKTAEQKADANEILAHPRHAYAAEGGPIDIIAPNQAEPPKNEAKEINETIDSLEFHDGKNKISVRLSKKPSRLYQVKIFINDEQEIRPMTYNGATTALGYWQLLKSNLKR